MIYALRQTSSFKKDVKLIARRGYDLTLLEKAIELLRTERPMPPEYRDHELSGNYAGHRECHIRPDWLLVYFKAEKVLVLTVTRTGTHSDIFGK